MLFSKEKITQTIFDAVEEVNILLSEEERLEKLPETLLASEKGNLDSLGLINFIVENQETLLEISNIFFRYKKVDLHRLEIISGVDLAGRSGTFFEKCDFFKGKSKHFGTGAHD